MPDPLPGPRLRQVALVAHDCEKTATALQETFGWPDPFHDPCNPTPPPGVISPVADPTAATWLYSRCLRSKRPAGG